MRNLLERVTKWRAIAITILGTIRHGQFPDGGRQPDTNYIETYTLDSKFPKDRQGERDTQVGTVGYSYRYKRVYIL